MSLSERERVTFTVFFVQKTIYTFYVQGISCIPCILYEIVYNVISYTFILSHISNLFYDLGYPLFTTVW